MTIAVIQSTLNYMLYTILIASTLVFFPAFIDSIHQRLRQNKVSDTTALPCNSKEVIDKQSEAQNASDDQFINKLVAIPATHQPIQLPKQWLALQRLAQLQDIPRWNRLKRPELEAQLRLALFQT